MELNFRTLKAEEIDVRVGTCSFDEKKEKYGCSLLLYKDARVDMALLDEVCKPFGWCREHKELKGVCYCGVGIKDKETGEWVFKWDAGAESFSDKEKGEASDSFKRACVNWGIGRELYTAGFVWVNLTKDDFYYDKADGKWKLSKSIKFSVKEIDYDKNRQINKLVITDQRGATCYTFPKQTYKAPKVESKPVAQPQREKPAEAEETGSIDILAIHSDIDAADTIAALRANVALVLGNPQENAIRKHAALRGIEIAKTPKEGNDAYELIKDRPGADEVWVKAKEKGQKNNWKK